MGAEIPVCPLCHTPRMPRRKGDAWFWGCLNYPTCTAPTTTTPPVPQNLKTLLLKQQTQAVNDKKPAKGCRHLLVKPLATGTGKGNTCQLCGAVNDKGEITGNSKSIQRKLVTDEEKHHPSQKVEGRTELDLVQVEVDDAKRLLEEAHLGSTSSPEQSDRSSIPSGTGDGEDLPDLETVGGEPGPSRSMKTGQKKRLLGGIKKTKTSGKDSMKPSWRRRNYREARTSQHSVSISVRPRRRKCMEFCSTPLPTCEEEPSCNTHVFWWQLLITKKIHTFACRYSMLPCSRFFEVHTYYSECWPSRRVRRLSGLLTRSNSSRVCLS